MKNLDGAVEAIIREIGLDQDKVERRKAFLELGESDVALLRELHARLAQEADSFGAAFARHLRDSPSLRALLPDVQTSTRLKDAQTAYFNSLTAGEYGADYVRNRLKVGLVHQRIGLAPEWYVGAYRKYLSELMPRLWTLLQHEQEKFLPTCDALIKVVCLDIGLALDTYSQADRQTILQHRDYAEQIVASMPTGLIVIDAHCTIRSMNALMRTICGLDAAAQVEHLALSALIDSPLLSEHIGQVLASGIRQHGIALTLPARDGGERYLEFNIARTVLAGEALLLLIAQDMTAQQQAKMALLHQANHDALTGLPNRSLLQERLAQAIAHADRSGRYVAVLLLELDRFKNINDSLGHDVGDSVLIEISQRLLSRVREGDTVARHGGDEYVIVLCNLERQEDAARLVQGMLQTFDQPLLMQGYEIYVTASIGISLYPRDGSDGGNLVKNADTAMYRAKDSGRNNFQFYAEEMNARSLDRLKLEGALRHALDREEFVLHYQPQVDIASGAIVGVEALIRWAPPGLPMVAPADFIAVAEDTGLIIPIGLWVLRCACAQSKAWQAAGLPPVRMAVNLSARQFQQQDIVRMVSEVLHETGCDPTLLELEITESVVMENPEAAAATLHRLSEMGIHLSVDDFGTGYSSLSYLKRFPINTLKIDRSFVMDVTTDFDDAAIVKAMIVLAQSLNLKVVAEGVETLAQLDFLRKQKCDNMQGYFFSRPVPAGQVEKLLSKARRQAG